MCNIRHLDSLNWPKKFNRKFNLHKIEIDLQSGLDHGAWSVIKHLYPKANIPVIQISIDYTKPAAYHFELAKQLQFLRNKGVLIIGSGNIVHNLSMVAWQRLNENFAFNWAAKASDKIKQNIKNENFQSLIDYQKQGRAFQMAIPIPEHFYPLLYILGLKSKNEPIHFFNDVPVAGALSMTSLRIG